MNLPQESTQPYRCVEDLADLLAAVPEDSIISRTFYNDAQVKTVLFAFAAGQALSEHTAASPAIIQILSGEAEIELGEARCQARAGTWIHMEPRLPHSVFAKTPLTMLLMLLKNPDRSPEP
jgi:quercetin dioxygenase-like cupin family protein